MSYHATKWVVENYHQNGSKKVAMLILAFHADDKGECFPASDTLAREIGVNERQVRLVMRQLETAGDIGITTGGGRRTNTYRILGFINTLHDTSAQPKKSATTTPKGQGATHPSLEKNTANNHRSEGALTTSLDDMCATESLHEIAPLGGYIQQGWEGAYSPSGGLSTTPELTYNNPLSTIEEIKTINYVVAPVGDDTAHTPLLASEMTTPESKDSHQTQEVTVSTGNGTDKHPSPPKTKTPPHPDNMRHLSEHQKMVGAIVKIFGWSFKLMTKNNLGLVGKVARELLEASATPDQIPALYEFCKGQKWSSDTFTPSALSKQWANFCAAQITNTGEISRIWTPPEGYAGFEHDYSKSVANMTDEEFNATYPDSANLTMAELKQKMQANIRTMVHKFTCVEELPIPEDDPMNEVLPW